jgi:hypothetical protein
MGEYERGAGDVTDFAGANGDVLEGAPAAGEQREAAFAQAAHGPLERIAGAVADIELAVRGGLADRDVDADSGALIAWIGQGSQPPGCSAIERWQCVHAGGGDVVHRARLHAGDPQGTGRRG